MLFTTWLVLGINLLLHQGWMGAFGQVVGGDFIMFYSTGLVNRSQPQLIYDYDTQSGTQQALVAPTGLPGYNPYMNPPFVAPVYSLLTYLPLAWAMLAWTILAIASVFLSVYGLYRIYLIDQKIPKFSYLQLVIIVLSFFPFVEGLQAGQNHWLTLLLVSGIIFAMFTEKGYLAGLLAGCLIYKPQFVLGFLILWLLWKNWRALLSFAFVALIWTGSYIYANGLNLFKVYLQLSQVFMHLPYVGGFPRYLLVTFYGLLASIFPEAAQPVLSFLSQALLVLSAVGLAWLAYRLRKASRLEKIPAIVAALVFPLLATPYALLHDMVILIPAYVLWTIYSDSRHSLYFAVSIYLGAFFLTFIGALTGIAWVAFLVIGLLAALVRWALTQRKLAPRMSVIQ